MDPKNVKGLYFRGNAYLEMQEFQKSVECLEILVKTDPNHADGKALLAKARKVRKEF
jgi:predicted Zn-dependent protease